MNNIPDLAFVIFSVFAGIGVIVSIVFIFILGMYALKRGGKIKKGDFEIDTEQKN